MSRRPFTPARLVALLGCVVLLLGGCAAAPPRPWPPGTRVDRWRQDLHSLAEQLPRRHKNAFYRISPATFRAAVDRLDARLAGLADHQIIVEFARLVALVGDAHTRLEFWDEPDLHWYPVLFQRFADGAYVVATAEQHREALGLPLTRVADRPLAQVRQRLAEIIPHENEAKLAASVPAYLRCAEALHALGVAPQRGRVRYTLAGEFEPLVVEMRALPAGERIKWVALGPPGDGPQPLYQQNRQRHYWWAWLDDQSTLYCAVNVCADSPDQPFADFAGDVLGELDRRGPERVIIDLRHNGGGRSALMAPLIDGLRQRAVGRRHGRLFCLIGNRTSSSAALNALQLRRATAAVLVGEPTGQKPNSFGEMRWFRLPNSGLTVTYSTRFFRVVEGDPSSVTPDVPAGLTFYDYLTGRDPALEAALAYDADR